MTFICIGHNCTGHIWLRSGNVYRLMDGYGSLGHQFFGTSRKVCSDFDILQSKFDISRSDVNMIMGNCMSLFSCKDVTMSFSILEFCWIPFICPMIQKCNITSNRNIRQIMTTRADLIFMTLNQKFCGTIWKKML